MEGARYDAHQTIVFRKLSLLMRSLWIHTSSTRRFLRHQDQGSFRVCGCPDADQLERSLFFLAFYSAIAAVGISAKFNLACMDGQIGLPGTLRTDGQCPKTDGLVNNALYQSTEPEKIR